MRPGCRHTQDSTGRDSILVQPDQLQPISEGRHLIGRLLRRASLLLALSLLTSAATAYAECAWIFVGRVPREIRAPSTGPVVDK
jgi:hypothetical protein